MGNDNIRHLFPTHEQPLESIPMRSIRELDEVATAARAAISGVLSLNRLVQSPLGNVSQAAETAQNTVHRMIIASPARPELVPTRLFKWGRRVDEIFTHKRRMGRRSEGRVTRLLSPIWMWMGIIITGAAAALVVTHHWYLATGLLILRVMISRRLGNDTNLPYEGRNDDRSSSVIYRCIAAHLCDCIMLLAVIWTLLSAGAINWAFLGVIATTIVLLGTLARVAAVQVGVQIFRLTLERVFRVGAMVIALVLTGVLQYDLTFATPLGIPYLAIAIVGPLLYGIGEAARTHLRIKHANTIYGANPSVSITVDGKQGTTRLVQPRNLPAPRGQHHGRATA